ncbi:AAA family ATPase [Allokutzneria oryzae]|uniref:AAA family ATPase n=1 Tax=Allokutzneria oryzae TaxID=1378989 RepID=A0ABV5ZXK2_9PSEU
MQRFAASPALARLEWILDGLDGKPGWGADASDVLSAAFTVVTPERYVEVTRGRAGHYAPVVVVGLDVDETTARARIRRHDGTVDVVTCVVEPAPPHRIATTWVTGLVPTDLTPRLPADFTDYDLPPVAADARLVVFSGLPGSGKSTLADAAGAELGIPVFAADWLLGALTPFGGRHVEAALDVAEEMLTTLALRQLVAGQSVILDHPVERVATRDRWRSLARRAGAEFRVVVCQCSDPELHRARLEGRSRGIPGWHDAGDWSDVRRRSAEFPSWRGEALVVDTAQPREPALAAALRHITT